MKMNNVISRMVICIFITFLAIGCDIKPKPAAVALNYNAFPPDLQQILDQRIAEVNASGGICVAGRVTMSDGASIGSGKDVKTHFADQHVWIYRDGWFILGRGLRNSSDQGAAKVVLRAFGYDPIDASIAVTQGKMTYAEFVMKKTPAEKLATIAGTIVNGQNEPVGGAIVNIAFPLSYIVANGNPRMEIRTEPNGHYSFGGLSASEYNLWVLAPPYAARNLDVTAMAGKTTINNGTVYPNLKILIDYVYQADGSRSFTEGNLKRGTVEWIVSHDGMDFSEGKVKGYEPKLSRDLEMRQDQDKLNFYVTYSNGKGNGFYDAGEGDFESVTEAAESDYTIKPKPCIIGQVYVVRTHENNYAKFVVRSISGSK
jgi:hypothetical protein